MKIVVQRVKQASVESDGEVIASINKGYLLLVCFNEGDDSETLGKACEKIRKLRIFEDEKQRMNFDILQVGGEILSISQFTLAWEGDHGHRPSFDKAMAPQLARLKYHQFNRMLQEQGLNVKEGVFGKQMDVSLINDGPVTFHLSF